MDLGRLINQRGRVKAKLTTFSNFIARIDAAPENKDELSLRIEKAESLLVELGMFDSSKRINS